MLQAAANFGNLSTVFSSSPTAFSTLGFFLPISLSAFSNILWPLSGSCKDVTLTEFPAALLMERSTNVPRSESPIDRRPSGRRLGR